MRLGATEILLLLALALILFGGQKISGIGKALGTSIREFKTEINTDTKETVRKADSDEKEKS
jgi:Sec-independent protein secretion pathway components